MALACGPAATPTSCGPAAVGSPLGSVPFGAKAYAPDCGMYAREVEPKDHGRIGVFELATGRLLRTIDVRQHPAGDYPNDLKGLAWSTDGTSLAVMYHHDGGGHISIINVDTGAETHYVPIRKWYHYIEFSPDGTSIRADGEVLAIP